MGRKTWPVVANDKKTWLTCDCCLKKHGQATFYELCSKTGKQVEVWYGMPRGWLMILGTGGTLICACSKKCARDHSSATRNDEFKPGLIAGWSMGNIPRKKPPAR